MVKTTLPAEAVGRFLQVHFPGGITGLERLVEGEESQAFSFFHGGRPCVVRINPSAVGFWKDAYAYQHFRSATIPIPKVVEIGQIDPNHAYCITERMPGITLQDADAITVERLLAPTIAVWQAIGQVDKGGKSGYGDFDNAGQAPFESWRAYLLSILDDDLYDWEPLADRVDMAMVREVSGAFQRLVSACPEERRLVHGDFGSNNVLTDGERISAVLDWDQAKYGDPLFDLAGAYFWRSWLKCMRLLAEYCEQHLSALPNYRERILCYQLWIGLNELYENAVANDSAMVEWMQRRCREILDSYQ